MAIAAIEPVRLTASQIDESGEVLARAFHTNPINEYLFPDETKRRRVMPWFLAVGSRYGHMFGEVHTTPGKVDASAVWLPPGETHMPLLRMARAGVLPAPLKMGGTFLKFLSVMDFLEGFHKRDVSPQHWYLFLLGVDPPRQRQGIGSALMQPILRRADTAGLPCYLETDKPEDVIFYQRHDYAVVRELTLPKGGPRVWTMRREPRS